MKRLIKLPYLATFAILLACGLAFAMKSETQQELVFAEYYVLGIDGDDFVMGSHPGCGTGNDIICKISSPVEPVNNRIPISTPGIVPLDWRPE